MNRVKIVFKDAYESTRIRTESIFTEGKSYSAKVESGNLYYLIDDNKTPVLVFESEIVLAYIYNSPLYKVMEEDL